MNDPSAPAAADDNAQALHVVITTSVELLAPEAAVAIGAGVLVFNDVDVALPIIERHAGQLRTLLVDVGDLGNRWTGLRLLRLVRGAPRLAHAKFWFLAARPEGGMLDSWVGSAGAAGITKRSMRGVQRVLAGSSEAAPAPGTVEAALARERLDTNVLLRTLGLEPEDWRAADGGLRLAPLVRALGATQVRGHA